MGLCKSGLCKYGSGVNLGLVKFRSGVNVDNVNLSNHRQGSVSSSMITMIFFVEEPGNRFFTC